MLSSCERFFVRNSTVMPFPRSTLARRRPQTLGLFLEKMEPLSLTSFELLLVACILFAISIIMRHDNSMHTLDTVEIGIYGHLAIK